MAIARRDATRLAQQILAKQDPSLVADGWWGSFTNTAYLRASPEARQAVDVVLLAAGTNVQQLLAATRVLNSTASSAGDGWITADQVEALIDRAVALDGGDGFLMRKFVRIEANQRMQNGVLLFNAKSTSPGRGTYKGLYQMGEDAWTDAQKRVTTLPGYDQVFDAWQNTRAANAYISVLQTQARAAGYKGQFTPEVLYAMHNQGAHGFVDLLRAKQINGAVRNQSATAQSVIKTAALQNGVRLA